MKFAFLVIAIFINFFNNSLIRSEEKVFSAKNKIENIAKKELISEEETEIKKIHVVKSGDTISSISKFYSINKDLIIKIQLPPLDTEFSIFVISLGLHKRIFFASLLIGITIFLTNLSASL